MVTPQQAPTDAAELLRLFNEDRAAAAATLFSHRHPQASPLMHVQIMDMWRSADPFVAVEAFREAGKSTLSEEFLVLEAAYGNFRYCLVFGETYTKACQRLAAIKHELMMNTKLQALFGRLQGTPWNDDTIVLANGVRLEAHGWEEEIRGYKWLDARPDRAYLDDIENASMVRDSATVDANWRKLNMQLIPALDRLKRKVRLTGTPLADDCLLSRCEASPEWVIGKFPVCTAPDAEGVEAIQHPLALATWPERVPLEDRRGLGGEIIKGIRSEFKRWSDDGLAREYVQEYMLISAQTQGKPFDAQQLVYQDYDPPGWVRKVAVMDPARTSNKRTSDRTGRVVLSRIGSRVYVHESGGEYWKPDAIVGGAFAMSEAHGDCEVAIERNSLDDWLMEPMRAEMLRRGKALDLMPILAPPDRSKEQFILGLQPWFAAGDIVLVGPRGKHAKLIAEITNFPSGKRDILNALAYGQRVFGGKPMYPDFSTDNIVQGPVAGQSDSLLVTMHATQSEVCAMLVAIAGQRMTVLADWTSALSARDTVKDIHILVRSLYPSRRVTWWVAADLHEQQGRQPLVEALRSERVELHPAGYVATSRGALADAIRSSMADPASGRRRKLLEVADTCKATLNALAGGYRLPLAADGRAKGEPERNVSATLMTALEVLTHEVTNGHTADALPAGFGSTMNAQGQPYFSALRRN